MGKSLSRAGRLSEYLWFDGDLGIQTPAFLVDAALAIVLESTDHEFEVILDQSVMPTRKRFLISDILDRFAQRLDKQS